MRLVNEDEPQLIMEANRLRNDYERNQAVHSENRQNKNPIQDEQPNKIIELVELDKSSQESNDINNNSHSTTGLNTKDGNTSSVIEVTVSGQPDRSNTDKHPNSDRVPQKT